MRLVCTRLVILRGVVRHRDAACFHDFKAAGQQEGSRRERCELQALHAQTCRWACMAARNRKPRRCVSRHSRDQLPPRNAHWHSQVVQPLFCQRVG